jgi:HAD superfamily phosphoserine phosphatase-like hydrolase
MDGAAQSAGLQLTVAGPVAPMSAHALMLALDETLEKIGTPARPFAAFDADGTLWTMDVGDALFESALGARLIREDAGDALRELALRHGLVGQGTACELAERLYHAYRAGLIAEHDCARMQVRCYAGWTRNELAGYAAEVLSRTRVTPQLFPPAMAMLQWARARGVRAIVVSASPAAAVEAAAQACGIDAQDVFAASTTLADGRYTATLDGPLPWGEQKAVLARGAVANGVWLASFGDSAFDLELLQRACVAVAVRPKPQLRAQFGQIAAPLYELVAADGGR